MLKTPAKLLGILGILVTIGALGVGGLYLYYFVILPPNLTVPDLSIERTPERIERGEYLATAAFGCVFCHSERD